MVCTRFCSPTACIPRHASALSTQHASRPTLLHTHLTPAHTGHACRPSPPASCLPASVAARCGLRGTATPGACSPRQSAFCASLPCRQPAGKPPCCKLHTPGCGKPPLCKLHMRGCGPTSLLVPPTSHPRATSCCIPVAGPQAGCGRPCRQPGAAASAPRQRASLPGAGAGHSSVWDASGHRGGAADQGRRAGGQGARRCSRARCFCGGCQACRVRSHG